MTQNIFLCFSFCMLVLMSFSQPLSEMGLQNRKKLSDCQTGNLNTKRVNTQSLTFQMPEKKFESQTSLGNKESSNFYIYPGRLHTRVLQFVQGRIKIHNHEEMKKDKFKLLGSQRITEKGEKPWHETSNDRAANGKSGCKFQEKFQKGSFPTMCGKMFSDFDK